MTPQEVLSRTNALLRLARACFDLYCQEHQVPAANRHDVSIQGFFQWLREDLAAEPLCQLVPELLEKAEVPYEALEELRALPENPLMFVHFYTLWEQVTLAGRGPLQHAVASIHMVALVKWEDGRVTPLSDFCPRELVNEAGTFTDGDACTMLKNCGRVLASLIAQFGLDGLHDQQSYLVTQPVVDLAAKALETGLSQMQPEAAAQMRAFINICQSYFDPPVLVPQAQAIIAQKRAARGQVDQVGGGWSE